MFGRGVGLVESDVALGAVEVGDDVAGIAGHPVVEGIAADAAGQRDDCVAFTTLSSHTDAEFIK